MVSILVSVSRLGAAADEGAARVTTGQVGSAVGSFDLGGFDPPEAREHADLATGRTVGMEKQLTVTMEGEVVVAKPVDRHAALMVRVAGQRPHGSETVYDFRYIGLVPGRYDLRDFLAREQGSALDDVDPLWVEVEGLLPPDHNGWLVEEPDEPALLSVRYQWVMWAGGLLWLAITVGLLRRRRTKVLSAPTTKEATWVDRLRPLVEKAAAGTMTTDEQAGLERQLIAFWQERCDLSEVPTKEAIGRLKEEPEAGQLLRALEAWLHFPPGRGSIDVEEVLRPYSDSAFMRKPRPPK